MKDRQSIVAIIIAIILSVILMFVCTGCKTQYIQGETITKEVRIVERDTTIVTEADSAAINALLYCDSAYNVVLGDLEMSEGERINLEWRLGLMEKNGRSMAALNIGAKEDATENNVKLHDKETNQVIERNIIEYRNSSFARFCIGYFWCSLAAIVLAIGAWAFRKFYLHI